MSSEALDRLLEVEKKLLAQRRENLHLRRELDHLDTVLEHLDHLDRLRRGPVSVAGDSAGT